jgi:hypothetical protein
MSDKTDGGAAAEDMPRTPVVDIIERMTVQELTTLIAATEAKRREKREGLWRRCGRRGQL